MRGRGGKDAGRINVGRGGNVKRVGQKTIKKGERGCCQTEGKGGQRERTERRNGGRGRELEEGGPEDAQEYAGKWPGLLGTRGPVSCSPLTRPGVSSPRPARRRIKIFHTSAEWVTQED